MPEWRDLSYLRDGSAAQRAAFAALRACNVLGHLARFDAVLVGTYPLDLAVTGSDLDVLGYAPDLEDFEAALSEAFGAQSGFTLERRRIRGTPASLVRFHSRELPVEVLGQDMPVEQQYAYRHMVVEARLLQLGGQSLRQAVLMLKGAAVKTEPAFAQVLGLGGDPYDQLWELSWRDDGALRALVSTWRTA